MSVAQVLAACEPDSDPDRRGAQVMLAAARSLYPGADLGELVAVACGFHPRMRELNPALAADVARRMGLVR